MTTYEEANDPDRILQEGRKLQECEEIRSLPQKPAQGCGGKETKRSRPPLTIERLREVLDYNPETGKFRWKKIVGRSNPNLTPKAKSINGYLRIQIDGYLLLQHRLAFFMSTGRWPKGLIDHINRDRSDNRIMNLREVSKSENAHNAGAHRDNTSGHKGVYWHKNINKWSAQIYIRGTNIIIGYFKNLEEAAKARAAAEVEYLPEIYKPAGTPESA